MAKKHIEIIIVISAIITLVILQLSMLAILKTKQNLNGGDLETIKKESLSNKKIIFKFLYEVQILIAILFGTFNLSISRIISSSITSSISLITIIATLIIALINSLTIARKRKVIRDLSEKDFNEKGQIILNKDDDDNYLIGMIYYNTKDPSLLVNKRMGVGMTFNFAHPIAKVINSFLLILLVSIFVVIIKLSISKPSVEFKDSNVFISCVYSNDINYKDINKIEYLKKIPAIGAKINGAGLGSKQIGYYRMKDDERAKLYLENYNKPCVFIELKNGENIYFNYKDENKTKDFDENKTKDFYEKLKNY